VLLDANELRSRWLDSVIRRNAIAPTTRTTVVALAHAEQNTCPAWAPLPAPLDNLAVCANAARPWSENRALRWQLLALVAVLALIAASTVARARALRRAEELAGIERAFVASVSHELRTPLTTLRMHAEMLKEGWVAEARRERVIDQLVDESARLSRLIEDVLTFGRLADGRAELAVETGDLSAKVRAVLERERARLEARGAQIDATRAVATVMARFDPTAVDQILTNLLDNAAKYAAAASDRTVVIAVVADDDRALLRVSDRGPGVPQAERVHVFERFYRGRTAVSSHVAGTGLGLAIVRGLALAMHGDAQIVDADAGCTIEVALPLEHAATQHVD
jgi:signal transduction histidine kinase